MNRSKSRFAFLAVIGIAIGTLIAGPTAAVEPCRIEVVEKGSGWPVPLVELRTEHQVRFVTDNAGVIAFDLPELMNVETWFDVIGQGYEVPHAGLGPRGLRLKPEPGKTLKVEVQRTIIARRIGRLTGSGLFAESQKLGLERDWRESGVLGCDSVQNAIYRGRLFWLWGDTLIPSSPRYIFDCTAATTAVPPLESFQPPLRVKFDYFTDEHGRPRAVARLPGQGSTWLAGLVSLPDKTGTPRLVGTYMKVSLPMHIYQWGLTVWNETTGSFHPLRVVWTESAAAPQPPPLPRGHAVFWSDGSGKKWLLFGDPLPRLRCPATFEAWQDSSTWEVLQSQGTIPAAGSGEAVSPQIGAHSGSIAWNPWRRRWVIVFLQRLGQPSANGELWYAEADAPTGPWGPAVKVLSHENYTFYNPRLHPEFTPDRSPLLFFEGTYTMTFAHHAQPTPRYEYNQILYRLDLDAPALKPAQRAILLPESRKVF